MTQALTVDVSTRRVDHVQMHVGGERIPAAAGVTFPTVDPSTGRTIAAVPRADSSDVDRAVAAAAKVAVDWQFTDAIERAALLRTLAGLVGELAEELAQLEALDSGHYLAKARELVGAIPLWLEYWAGLADKVGGRTIAVPGNKLSFTCSNRSASPRTSCPGTTPCSSSSAPPPRRWRWATRAWSSRPSRPRCRRSSTPISSRRRASRRACSTSSPAMDRRRAPRWPLTPTSWGSPSPARRRPGAPWPMGCGPPRLLRLAFAHHLLVFMFGEDLPIRENAVTLDPEVKDSTGLPAAHIEFSVSENDRRLCEFGVERITDVATALGARETNHTGVLSPPPGWHLMGTARMGNTPEDSVTNMYNQAWEIHNLFIADGSSLTTGGAVNPTSTIGAIATRAAEYISQHFGEIVSQTRTPANDAAPELRI